MLKFIKYIYRFLQALLLRACFVRDAYSYSMAGSGRVLWFNRFDNYKTQLPQQQKYAFMKNYACLLRILSRRQENVVTTVYGRRSDTD